MRKFQLVDLNHDVSTWYATLAELAAYVREQQSKFSGNAYFVAFYRPDGTTYNGFPLSLSDVLAQVPVAAASEQQD